MADRTFTVEVSRAGAEYVAEAAKRFGCDEALVLRALFSVGSIHKEEAETKLKELRAAGGTN